MIIGSEEHSFVRTRGLVRKKEMGISLLVGGVGDAVKTTKQSAGE